MRLFFRFKPFSKRLTRPSRLSKTHPALALLSPRKSQAQLAVIGSGED
jgi:hypothetical protein